MKRPIKKHIIEDALMGTAQINCKNVSEIYDIVEKMTGESRTTIRRTNKHLIAKLELIVERLTQH